MNDEAKVNQIEAQRNHKLVEEAFRKGLGNLRVPENDGQYDCYTTRPNVHDLIEMKIKEHHTAIEELQALKDSLPSKLDMQKDFAIFRLISRIK